MKRKVIGFILLAIAVAALCFGTALAAIAVMWERIGAEVVTVSHGVAKSQVSALERRLTADDPVKVYVAEEVRRDLSGYHPGAYVVVVEEAIISASEDYPGARFFIVTALDGAEEVHRYFARYEEDADGMPHVKICEETERYEGLAPREQETNSAGEIY